MPLKVNGDQTPQFTKFDEMDVKVLKVDDNIVWGKPFLLTIDYDNGVSINVKRTSSPNQNASLGDLQIEDTIYYGDVLEITLLGKVNENYLIFTVNGENWTSGKTLTVKSDVNAKAYIAPSYILGTLHIETQSGYEGAQIITQVGSIIAHRYSSDHTEDCMINGNGNSYMGEGSTLYHNDVLYLQVLSTSTYSDFLITTFYINDKEVNYDGTGLKINVNDYYDSYSQKSNITLKITGRVESIIWEGEKIINNIPENTEFINKIDIPIEGIKANENIHVIADVDGIRFNYSLRNSQAGCGIVIRYQDVLNSSGEIVGGGHQKEFFQGKENYYFTEDQAGFYGFNNPTKDGILTFYYHNDEKETPNILGDDLKVTKITITKISK